MHRSDYIYVESFIYLSDIKYIYYVFGVVLVDLRKIQVTGGSSYMITLPKDWVDNNNLTKNRPVGVLQQPDGTLTIVPKLTGESVVRKKVISVGDSFSPRYLFRLLVGAYVMGYTLIDVESESHMGTDKREAVTEFIQVAVGPEIVEETDNFIQIRDLLNPVEMPFANTLNRMHVLITTMRKDAISTLSKKGIKLAEDVVSRDVEVNRLHWLIAHQYNLLVNNPLLSKNMGVLPQEARFHYLASMIMERISDHTVTIAKNAPSLTSKKYKPVRESIRAANDTAMGIFNESMNSWFNNDVLNANRTIESLPDLDPLCNSISAEAYGIEPQKIHSVDHIAESIRRTGEYSANICELIIDHLIGEV
ncbi:MAG: AbrB/MazE/SpoVT family DNA-binding domain-containing protein [Candidatus Altiarchaeales archaeon]|nr:AbrB/MazE/SpoVT family DNA-binding domain-containing protein [Candidatus Altiarchaeales archaeon]MBD3416420.1 AbrB/MazE/SpoVT family DNA-binding domain-containing protein [Candidatus Altiarchaeales archaeon]